MSGSEQNMLRRRSIVEKLIEKPPFRYEKSHPVPSQCESLRSEDIEKIINISMPGNNERITNYNDIRSSKMQIPNRSCQTTINLYINDPHMMETNMENHMKLPSRRRLRNEIVLGKNIPDHTLMKNLLGDLGVKKYSSAPNMTKKYLNNRRILSGDRYPSERSFIDPSESTYGNSRKSIYPEKGMKFLYVNDGRNGGDFKRNNIEEIKEEEEELEGIKDKIYTCPVHYSDHSEVNVRSGPKETVEGKPQINLRDPLKRFKRKPFSLSQLSKNPSILYRDIAAPELSPNEKPEQPTRKTQSFHVRTQMFRDILNTNPELMHSYQSGLMRNHKGLFETLRHKNFEHITNDKDTLQRNEPLPIVKGGRKIDQINEKQSKLVLYEKNKQPICSVESHGSYEEYKKNLVKGPDGTLCCKNTEYTDDDIWSRAETRNIITSEFVKDKIQKFDELFRRKGGILNGSEVPNENKLSSRKPQYKTQTTADYYQSQGQLSHHLLNEADITFPRETKNAMTTLMSKNSRMFIERQDSNSNGKIFGTLQEIRKLSVPKRTSTDPSSSCQDSIKSSENNNRCWPGVAERVQSPAEGNTT